MSIFARIARRLHDAETFFADLHERYWLWKHRHDTVIVAERNHSGEWIPSEAHWPDADEWEDDEYWRYRETTLAEARREGCNLNGCCFTEHRVHTY